MAFGCKVLKLMNFTEEPRVVYERNPLAEVVCQLRFPRLLELDDSVPANFQKSLGRSYPSVESRQTVTFHIGNEEGTAPPTSRRVIYDFSDRDRQYTISLCSDFLAVKTVRYTRWETFLSHIQCAISALRSSYDVPFYSRLGLRYVNIIKRADLGISDVPWTDLIRGSALGLLGDGDIPIDSIIEQSSATVLSIGNGRVAIRSGINIADDGTTKNYVVDSDFFFDSPMEKDEDAYRLLAYYNGAARNAFRWHIKPRLHDAMEPRDA